MTGSSSVPLPIFLSGSLPIRSVAAVPSPNCKNNVCTKACDTFRRYSSCKLKVSSGVTLTQNKIVLLSSVPPVHKTSPFFHRSSLSRLVLIVCHQFVNYAITLWNFMTICAIQWLFLQYEWLMGIISSFDTTTYQKWIILFYFFHFLRAPVMHTVPR